ncbi:MAG TPA: AraC family ligand binding domain-containing protein, partial [Burkholderiales bacterium]|nr:AraC family ligand binding domain-containing protein [Burkholderiales bacterium]
MRQPLHGLSRRANEYMAVPRPVVALARDLPPSHEIDWHSHPRYQLVYAARGVMTVDTREATWVVPPQRAVWMPPAVEHRLKASGAIELR